MARKSKEDLLKEFAKERIKYMRHVRELERCHQSSKRHPELLEKAITSEENCIFLNPSADSLLHSIPLNLA